jgi:hypothetical protein
MKSLPLILTCLLVSFLGGCTRESWQKAFTTEVLQLSYDDFGTEAIVSPVLGPRGTDLRILINHGSTNSTASPRRLNTYQGLLMLRRNAHRLPRTPENEALRQRMSRTYNRLYHSYRTRREAMLASPPSFGRGAMPRMQMMPPVPPML